MLDLNYSPKEVVDTDGMPNDEWLKYRTTGIGGSDVAAIYEVSPWTTKRALYYAKIGLEKEDSPNPYTLMFGHAMEPFVVQWFLQNKQENIQWLSKKMGFAVKDFYIYKDTVMYQHPLFPFMQANLDYRITVVDAEGNEHNGVFECKTTSYHIGPDHWNNEQVPYYYELQTRHYMAIMNLGFTVIACAWGNNVNDYAQRFITRDLDLEEEMIEMERDFWENSVKAKSPPALNTEHAPQEDAAFQSYRIRDRIKRGELQELQHPQGDLLDAAKRYEKAQETLIALKSKQAEVERDKTAASIVLMESMPKDDKDLVFKSGDKSVLCRFKKSRRSGIDSKRLREELPDVAKQFTKVTESETFQISIF